MLFLFGSGTVHSRKRDIIKYIIRKIFQREQICTFWKIYTMNNIEELGCLVEIQESSSSGLVLNDSYILTPACIILPHLIKHHHPTSTALQDSEYLTQAMKTTVKKLQVKVVRKQKNRLTSQQVVITHVWKAAKFTHACKKLFPKYAKWKFTDDNGDGNINSTYYDETSVSRNMDNKARVNSTEDQQMSKALLLAELMPYFMLLRLSADGSSGVLDDGGRSRVVICDNVQKGENMCVVGTPFGGVCPTVFFNSVSAGVVSQIARDSVILTDAKVAPGSEGAPVCVLREGVVCVAGVIVSSLFWKNTEWLGMSVVCSITDILDSLYSTGLGKGLSKELVSKFSPTNITTAVSDNTATVSPTSAVVQSHSTPALLQSTPALLQSTSVLNRFQHCVVLVQGHGCWGSGVVIDKHRGYILTCAHVIKHCSIVRVCLWNNTWIETSIVHRCDSDDPIYDLALLKVRRWTNDDRETIPDVYPTVPVKGSAVSVIGHTPFGSEHRLSPSVSRGVITQVVYRYGHPVLIQTSCTVQAGASGGPVVDQSGQLIGIVTSNAKDTFNGGSYPHVNLVVPAVTVWPVIQQYIQTQDVSVLEQLQTSDPDIMDIWRLRAKFSPKEVDEVRSKL